MNRLATRVHRTDGRNSYSVTIDYSGEVRAIIPKCALATCGAEIPPRTRRPYDKKSGKEWCRLNCWLKDNQIGEPKP